MKKVLSVVLAIVFCFACGISALAEESPTAEKYYTIDAVSGVVGAGSAIATPSVAQAGDIITLTAVAADGFVFDHWELDGMYEIVEGTIYDPVIKVQVKPGVDNQTHDGIEGTADIRGVAHFRPASPEITTGEQQTAKPDDGPNAPQTGTLSTQAIVVIALSVAGLMAVAFVYKKRTEKTK